MGFARFRTAVAAAFIGLAGPLAADAPVVVELFTSQGCSSCPPADAMLVELAARDDVIALAFHVDYWDYLGWKDQFGSAENTQRQHGYARAAGSRTVYTPQLVINGVDHVIGAKPMRVADRIMAHKDAAPRADVSYARDGDTVTVTAQSEVAGDYIVQLVQFMPLQTVDVMRGENAGRTLTYANIVTDLMVVGEWDGQGDFAADLTIPAGMTCAIVIQSRNMGPVLGAVEIN